MPHQIRSTKNFAVGKDCRPSLKQIAGSVVSSNPEQIAFKTATLSNLPEEKKKIPNCDTKNIEHHTPKDGAQNNRNTSVLPIVDDKGWQYCDISSFIMANLYNKRQELSNHILMQICKNMQWLTKFYINE